MNIGKVKIENNLFLSPMAGVGDVAFRTLCKKFGAGLTTTEMVSVKALYFGDKKTLNYLKTDVLEKPVAVQLFGNDPEVFAEVVKLEVLQKFDIIDINMGCPATKIIKNKEGSALMKDLSLASQIIKSCVENTDKPVTVKFRKGFDKDNCVEFAKMCENSGASAVCIHGRLASQMYSGNVDLKCIKNVKDAIKIPVIGNGDVEDKDDFLKMINFTNCDAVSVGRGACGKPWIFQEILKNKTEKNIIKIIKNHIKLSKKHKVFNLLEMRKHFAWYVKNLKGGAEVRNNIFKAKNEKEIYQLFKKINV